MVRYIIPVGSMVVANNEFKGMVISVSIRKANIIYEVQQTTESSAVILWFNDWEITSKHKSKTLIRELLDD